MAASGIDFRAVTPSDAADIGPHRALWISAAGTVAIMNNAGDTLALGSLAVGTLIPCAVKRVMSTGTTATVLKII